MDDLARRICALEQDEDFVVGARIEHNVDAGDVQALKDENARLKRLAAEREAACNELAKELAKERYRIKHLLRAIDSTM